MARNNVRVEGLRELERALAELPKATGKRVAREVLKEAAQPIADAGQANAPLLTGGLKESYGVGTKLTRRQRKLHKKQSPVEVFAGPNNPAAVQTEFGNQHQAAEPHLRPAWDGNKTKALDIIKTRLWDKISAAAARLARKQARAAAKGK
jgi:HK97 gp10 family phage protein